MAHGIGAQLAISMVVAALAGCSSFGWGRSDPPPGAPRGDRLPSAAEKFLAELDTDRDGVVTRAELEGALRVDFDMLDLNRNGGLDHDEVWTENNRRWTESRTTTSPLFDWNKDTIVDFDEFSSTTRSSFRQLDRNADGTVDRDELRSRPVRRVIVIPQR